MFSQVGNQQKFDQRNNGFQKLKFPLGIFFEGNNVAKLVVDNSLCDEIVATCCQLVSN